jgi:hypothetical protein
MVIRRTPESGRRAVMLLATVFVVFIGAVATAFTVLAAAERAGWAAWGVWLALFGSVVLCLWALWDGGERKTSPLQLLWQMRRKPRVDPLLLYKPRKKRFVPERPWGSNQPPTLESLREAAEESSVTWVPHGPPPERERPPRRA